MNRGKLRLLCLALVLADLPMVFCADEPTKPKANPEPKEDNRLPVPPAVALVDSEKQIKDIFKDEYLKKGSVERIDLAKRLLKLAGESKNDGLAYYVALREAKDIAVSAGELDTAFAAVDALTQAFVVDVFDAKVGVLTGLTRTTTTPES
jgi:hypothetical protein